MTTVSPAWTSFTGGELSPRLEGRVDLPQYMKGGRIVLNWIPTVQGAMVRRGGTRLIANAVNPVQPSLLLPFSRSRTESYLIEAGDQVFRFFFDDGIVLSGGVPFILPTPYRAQDLFNADATPALSTTESIDQVYIANARNIPQVLSFFGPITWTLQPLAFFDGPWDDGNTDLTLSMHITGPVTIGSTITITCDAPYFVPAQTGALIRIHQQDLTTMKPWQPGQKTPVISVGAQRRAGFNTYQCANASSGAAPAGATTLLFVQTGSDTLTHTHGNAWDGDQSTVIDPIGSTTYYSTGMQWTYEDCGYGIAQIVNVPFGGLSAQAVVKRQFPASLTSPAGKSTFWELGAWNLVELYPSVTTFYNERLAFFGRARVWMSVVGDFQNFADLQFGEVLADGAVTTQVLSDQYNPITWVAPQTTLIIGTEGGEFVVGQQSISDAYGPTNSRVSPQSNFGGRACGAIRVQTNTLFVSQNGRSIREFSYVFASDAYQSNDMAVESEHITASGIVGMTWAKNPFYVVWAWLADGTLIGFTYNPEQAVKCWHRHDVGAGGQVVSATTIPSADGTTDDVYLCVKRSTLNNDIPGVLYSIEKLEQPIDPTNGDRQDDAFYVDCGLTLANTINATLSVSGDSATVGATCFFITGTPAFAATDVGRYIHYDYTTTVIGDDGLLKVKPAKAIALITQFTFSTSVQATIVAPFPALAGTIPANGWRMTVTEILGASIPIQWYGNTISILADGAALPDVTVGTVPADIPLSVAASVVTAGLRSPAVWQSMRPDIGDPTGQPIGKKRCVKRATARVLDELGVKMGRTIDDCDPINLNGFDVPNNEAPPLRTGNSERMDFNGSFDEDGRVLLTTPQPLPATICAVGVMMELSEDS